jgi:CBS domain containing-hemolysin-like protein
MPAIVGALLQSINGVVFIGEGIQQGNQYFGSLAISTTVATIGMLISLKLFGQTLFGVWASFGIFNLIRLVGVLQHHFITGPLAPKQLGTETEE